MKPQSPQERRRLPPLHDDTAEEARRECSSGVENCNDSAPHQLLVIDDDQTVREALVNLLEAEGLAVTSAASGKQALALFAANAPDLVLLDINMPGMSGWEVFNRLERLHPFVPCIIVTAYPGQFGRANSLGVDAIMEKPIDLPLLVKTIHGILAESRRERVQRIVDRGFMTRNLTAESVVRDSNHAGWPIA